MKRGRSLQFHLWEIELPSQVTDAILFCLQIRKGLTEPHATMTRRGQEIKDSSIVYIVSPRTYNSRHSVNPQIISIKTCYGKLDNIKEVIN